MEDSTTEEANKLISSSKSNHLNELIGLKQHEQVDHCCNGRSNLIKLLGKTLIFMTVVSFLFVGIIINILQLILLISIKFSQDEKWIQLHKKINGHLVYILFAPPICIIYNWSQIELNIQLDDVQLIEDSKKPLMGLIIPNHSYELDYMICFILADQLGNLGCYKSLSKDELKYLPIIGWSMWMSDIIFVKRNWQHDRKFIGKSLNELSKYEQFLLGIFAEGTRWTFEKHELSKKFAELKGFRAFKYHLVPKNRGFNYTVRHYLLEIEQNKQHSANKPFRIFNLQIILRHNVRFKDFMNGKQLAADVYCEEAKLSDEIRDEVLKSRNEDDCPKLTKFLQDIYRRKDEIVEEYRANSNKFLIKSKTGGPMPFKPRMKPFLIWLLGFACTYSTLAYLAFTTFARSFLFWSTLLAFIGSCIWMLKRIEDESIAKNVSRTNI